MASTTYPKREVWMSYDCPHSFDFDLHDERLVYKGQRFHCSGCGGEHVAGVDVQIQVGVDVEIARNEYDYDQRQFVDLPESADALRALVEG
ncbi:hypothetical protein [Acidovorax sp. NB1]|uniref:hypothetical protein n=1 Tax=Acidovorax sp. NB1 TaxID=1943571 RepID=UPI0010DF20F0|nr:hypothetical protein [Acidovorax sp. NB1]GDY37707.1 hypothetical protein ACINB_35990 [Acidovorax sp. NB1]